MTGRHRQTHLKQKCDNSSQSGVGYGLSESWRSRYGYAGDSEQATGEFFYTCRENTFTVLLSSFVGGGGGLEQM